MALGFNIWQEDGEGKVSVRQAYNDAINHTYEWGGRTWRMWAENAVVLVIERDGERHRIKCVNNARTYGNCELQIMKTQVKFLRYGVAWLVAAISGAFRDDEGVWLREGDRRINSYWANHLEELWKVRPLKK